MTNNALHATFAFPFKSIFNSDKYKNRFFIWRKTIWLSKNVQRSLWQAYTITAHRAKILCNIYASAHGPVCFVCCRKARDWDKTRRGAREWQIWRISRSTPALAPSTMATSRFNLYPAAVTRWRSAPLPPRFTSRISTMRFWGNYQRLKYAIPSVHRSFSVRSLLNEKKLIFWIGSLNILPAKYSTRRFLKYTF